MSEPPVINMEDDSGVASACLWETREKVGEIIRTVKERGGARRGREWGKRGAQEEGESSTAEPADLSLLWASNAEGLKRQILAP